MRVVSHFSGDLRVWLGSMVAHWRGDLTGGLTAAVVALPLALVFAVASGVDPFETTDAAIFALSPDLDACKQGVVSNLRSEEWAAYSDF